MNQENRDTSGQAAKRRKAVVFYALILGFLLLTDQYTKHLAWNSPALEIKPDGAFGLWNRANVIENRWEYAFFIFMTAAVPAVWMLEHRSGRSNRLVSMGFILIWAGIIGNNLIDAFMFGYIRDFIWVEGLGCGNVADQQKYLGCALIIAGIARSGGVSKTGVILSMLGVFAAIALFFYLRWNM